MKRIALSMWILLAVLALGCSDDPVIPYNPPYYPPAPEDHTGYMRATIDGHNSDPYRYFRIYRSMGTDWEGSITISAGYGSDPILDLTLSFISGPGTYPLGVNPETTPGGTAKYNPRFLESWETPLTGASGFVTITARTDKRIAGTFHFTADKTGLGDGPPTISFTNGEFDITCLEDLPPLPTGAGSTFSGTVGDASFNAATVMGINPGFDTFQVDADNLEFDFKLWSKVTVAAGNTYGIPSQIEMRLDERGTPNAWSGGSGPDVGTLTVLSQSADRIVATFTATLPSLVGSPEIAVTGEVDSHLKMVAAASLPRLSTK
jgi:hypothetical protein